MYIIDKTMAIALYHWSIEEYQESLVLAILGIAATSKLHYPREKDRKAFESYVKDKLTEITSRYLYDAYIPGKVDEWKIGDSSLQSVLYKSLRCNIIHELKFPDNIKLCCPTQMNKAFEVGPDETITFSNRLPLALIYTVLDDSKVFDIRINQSED